MKRLTALFLCLLLYLCACTAPAAQTASSSESMGSSASVSDHASGDSVVSSATGDSNTETPINTNILTEKKAHELLSNWEYYSVNCTQYGYISDIGPTCNNAERLQQWVKNYENGIPDEVAVFQVSSPLIIIYVLTSTGSQQYTITLYANHSPTSQYISSVVTERAIEYTFCKDTDLKWPITIRKPYDAEKYSHELRYEKTNDTFAPASLKSEHFYAYIYDAKAKDYLKKPADASNDIQTIRDFFTEIEESLAIKLDITRIVQDGDLVYINFAPDSAPTGMSKEQEQTVLSSMARTVMENQKGVFGVCFEENGNPYHSDNLYLDYNSIFLPVNTPSLGNLSIQEASSIAREKLNKLHQFYYSSSFENAIFSVKHAEYVQGILCYVFDYFYSEEEFEKNVIGGSVVLDAEQGTLFFDVSMEDGSYFLFSDDNEKQITPKNTSASSS